MKIIFTACCIVIAAFSTVGADAQGKDNSPVHPIAINMKWVEKNVLKYRQFNAVDEVDVTSEQYAYQGDFVNNMPEGVGTISRYNSITDRHIMWTYQGQVSKGMANGSGVFRKFGFDLTKLNPDPKHIDTISEFRGSFSNGFPIEGMLKMELNAKNEALLFYSGGVCFTGDIIVQQGWGNMMRSNRADYSIGVAGGFYSGQFFCSSMTGWGLANLADEDGSIQPRLVAGLFAADKLIRQYNSIAADAHSLIGGDVSKSGATANALLPGLAGTKTGKIDYADYTYYGAVNSQNEPYGLGYILYPDGFRDVGIWQNGKRLHPSEVLKTLLPDSTVLAPQIMHRKKGIIEEVYALSAGGFPDGWGWSWEHPEGDFSAIWNHLGPYNYPRVQKFEGSHNPAQWFYPTDTSLSLQPYISRPDLYYNADERLFERQYRTNLTYRVDVPGPYDPYHPAPGYIKSYQYTALGDERAVRYAVRYEASKKQMAALLFTQGAKEAAAALSKLQQLEVYSGHLDRSHPEKSILNVSSPVRSLHAQTLRLKDLQVNDYLIGYNGLLRVVGTLGVLVAFDDGSSVESTDKLVPVFRGYALSEIFNANKCEHCKGTGIEPGTSRAGGDLLWYVSSYKTTVSWASPGMEKVTTTPVLSYAGQSSPVIGKTCTFCKGRSAYKTKTTFYSFAD